jgi:hypothetical protein
MKIRLAKTSDTALIKNFIKLNWGKKNHIFVRDKFFFKFEMCPFKKPNFAIALINKKIIGIVGFTCNHDNIHNGDLFLVMFKVLKQKKITYIGFNLIKYVTKLTSRGVHTIGANEKVLNYYKFLGFKTGYLDHYYWLNDCKKITKIFHKKELLKKKNIDKKKIYKKKNNIFELDKKELLLFEGKFKLKVLNNRKSINFIIRRFINHPIYEYSFFCCSAFPGIGVIRKVNVKGNIGWRIIDWYGALKYFDRFCKKILIEAKNNNVSYVDLYVYGVNKKKLIRAGLKEISEDVIIPNYLEPLVLKNINISYATNQRKVFFLRGDGDQDRPS